MREPRGAGQAEIKIKNVAKQFGTYQALSDINLASADQEFMVLLGASGCGKTTLMRVIAGLESQSEGEVWIRDRRIDHRSPKDRCIAMVFQNYAVFPHLTVFENIGFDLRMQKLPNDEARAWAEIETMMAHQWEDGMAPLIIFHEEDAGYFPGPDVWSTNRPTPTSDITQPAVAGFAVRRNFDRARDKALVVRQTRAFAQDPPLAPMVLRASRPAGHRAGSLRSAVFFPHSATSPRHARWR